MSIQHLASVVQYCLWRLVTAVPFPCGCSKGVGLACALIAFIARRFEGMTGAVHWRLLFLFASRLSAAGIQQAALRVSIVCSDMCSSTSSYFQNCQKDFCRVLNLCQASQQIQQGSDMRMMPWSEGGEYLPNMTSEAVAGMPTPALDLR